jgi:hypothetical protein
MHAHIDARIHTRKKTHSNVRMCKEEKKKKKKNNLLLYSRHIDAHKTRARTNEKITLNSARIKADDKREREEERKKPESAAVTNLYEYFLYFSGLFFPLFVVPLLMLPKKRR